MLIAKIEGSNITVADYRELFPGTSFPPSGPSAEFLAEQGCMGVTVWKAHDSKTEKLVPAAPYVDGGTVYTVAVQAKTQEDMAADTASQAAQVRADRNRRLAASDWTQVADAPVDKAAWAIYRQSLRDISDQGTFPSSVTWPQEPGAQEITIGGYSAGPL